MTRKETGMIMAILQAAFPAYYRNASQADAETAVNLWSEMFATEDARAVTGAVKALIATQTQGYPPTIGAVKEQLETIREPDRMTAQDAWALAAKAAAGNLAWEKLPTIVQRAIGSKNVLKDWGMTDTETFGTVIYSQFVKAFGTVDKRERDEKKLPENVRLLLNEVRIKALPDGGEKA